MAKIIRSKVQTNGASSKNGSSKAQPQKKGLRDLSVKTVKETKKCPISRDEFEENATPLAITLDGQEIEGATDRSGEEIAFELEPVAFSTGTLGYYLTGNIVLNIGGVEVPCFADFKVYLSNSKPKD